MDRLSTELGFPDRRQFSDRRNNFLCRRADDIVVAQQRGPALSDLVLYLVRNCRRAGFGLSRSKTISYAEMAAGLDKLIDDMANETGFVMRGSDRQQLVEQIPHYAYHVDVMHPQESLSGACWAATRALQSLWGLFKETGDLAALKKGEGLLEFLTGLELDVAFAEEVARFKQQFAEAQSAIDAQKGIFDRWLDKVVRWRQAQLVRG